jgi:hypothetical protein
MALLPCSFALLSSRFQVKPTRSDSSLFVVEPLVELTSSWELEAESDFNPELQNDDASESESDSTASLVLGCDAHHGQGITLTSLTWSCNQTIRHSGESPCGIYSLKFALLVQLQVEL